VTVTLPDEPVSISLNGVDNVGKSTQGAWLHRGIPGVHAVGTVDAWDSRWQEVAAGDFARWWFADSSTAEHVRLMLGSHYARRSGSGRLALEDRGLPMLRAACAATAAVKEGIPVAEALRLVDRIAADLPAAQRRREVHVLLRRSDDPIHEAREALLRERRPTGERYAAYQRALAEITAVQAERGEYDAVLDIGDAPILDVQRQLRTRLAAFGLPVVQLPDTSPDRLWVLAGLSEGGKSTVGALLRDEHGATRLKIGYLLEVAALRAGAADPYQWPEPEQAERLTEEILRFAAACKADVVSIESAHWFEATAHLKRVWGNRCQLVYVDAAPAIRASRTAESEDQLRVRDTIKRGRGAHRIARIADHVIDNSGSLAALKFAVTRLVSTACLRHAAPPSGEAVTNSAWLAEAAAHLLDDQVALVLATGSTGTAAWRDGWSDLDLLAVRDTAPAAWLRSAAGTLPAPERIKVAVSVFTTGDIDALRVPPRVVQSLRRAARGIGVLYQRPGYLLPVPAQADADRTSRGELGLVLMTTRRLLADADTNVRALYKHLVLLAKIVLRADGHDFDDAEDALTAFSTLHPAADCAPPRLDILIRQPCDPAVRDQLVAAADRLVAYIDQLGQAGRTSA
jgi:hypothetical protein